MRIDAVHYCDREAELVTSRKRRSCNGRTGNVRDAPQERLRLLARTVRENDRLAHHVKVFKTPYMTRETCQADLARIVSVLPNLCYVDLPDGFFNDSPSSDVLRQELQSSCPSIRRMKYVSGAEGSFASLGQGRHWRLLEDLELYQLEIDTPTLLDALQSLPAIDAVRLCCLPLCDDHTMASRLPNGSFPALSRLHLKDLPSVTEQGLAIYLSRPDVSRTMSFLALSNTGVHPSSLHLIVSMCLNLRTLHVSENVSRPFPISSVPLLASRSLQSLTYEISAPRSKQHLQAFLSESYYSYLAKSVTGGWLPTLTHLYALSTSLPSMLLQRSTAEQVSPSSSENTISQGVGLKHPLCVYTKEVSELEWNLTVINPSTNCGPQCSYTATRPMSLYHTPSLSPQWRDKGRESTIVGNGFGGFLMVPGQDGGPMSPGKKSPRKERNAWMG